MTERENTWEVLQELVAAIDYRPGWQCWLADTDQGKEFQVSAVGYDSYHPENGETYRVLHSFIVPNASYNRESWTRWILDRLIDIETHETCEFFKLKEGDKVRRPFAPNHGPGWDPYMVRELNTVEAAETTFRGERREGTQG